MKGNRQLILSSQDDEICILGSVHHVLKTKRLKSSDIQVLPYLKKRNVRIVRLFKACAFAVAHMVILTSRICHCSGRTVKDAEFVR